MFVVLPFVRVKCETLSLVVVCLQQDELRTIPLEIDLPNLDYSCLKNIQEKIMVETLLDNTFQSFFKNLFHMCQ